MEKAYQYEIMIGLNDKDNHEKTIRYHEISNELKRVTTKYQSNFSSIKIKGGYLYEDNYYVIENCLLLILIMYTKEDAIRVAKHFKEFFNQENVLLIKKEADVLYE